MIIKINNDGERSEPRDLSFLTTKYEQIAKIKHSFDLWIFFRRGGGRSSQSAIESSRKSCIVVHNEFDCKYDHDNVFLH